MFSLKYDVIDLAKSFNLGTKRASYEGVLKTIKETKQLKEERQVMEDLKRVAEAGIYVGIPESNAPRAEGEMNNAALLFIHTNGSPVRGIPARPLIEPALRDPENDAKIAEDLAEISRLILDGKYSQARKMMEITGQDATAMIDDWFESPKNNWPPNKDSTVKAKLRKTGKSLKERNKLFEKYQAGKVGINTPLIDTGALRRSITYVLGDDVK